MNSTFGIQSEMKPEDYTPDTICLAMGLRCYDPGAISQGWVVRILLMPSFHPEICITLTGTEADLCLVETRVAVAQIWSNGISPQFVWCAASELASDVASRLFRYVKHAVQPPRPPLVLDGMPYTLALRTPNGLRNVEGHASATAEADEILRDVLQTLHEGISDAACVRGLALAARYLGLNLDTPDACAIGAPIRFTVLGSNEERDRLLQGMTSIRARQK